MKPEITDLKCQLGKLDGRHDEKILSKVKNIRLHILCILLPISLQKKRKKSCCFFFCLDIETISLYISLSRELRLYDTNLMSQCKLNFFQMQQEQMPKENYYARWMAFMWCCVRCRMCLSFIHKQSTQREARNQHVSKLGIQCNVSQAIDCLNYVSRQWNDSCTKIVFVV